MNNSNQIYTNANESGLNRFFSKMYGFMAGAVAFSALIAYLCSTVFQAQVMNLFGHGFAFLFLFVFQIAMVFAVSFKPNRSAASSITILFVFAGIEGLFLSSVLMVFAISQVTMAFVAASADFIVLSIFGATTKKDLSGIGRQAFAALIALFIVMFINMFLQSPLISYVFSFAGVVIFTILTAWDTQTFKAMYLQYGDQVNSTSLAVSGALQLYLDFINLFLQLLSIFSGGGSKR